MKKHLIVIGRVLFLCPFILILGLVFALAQIFLQIFSLKTLHSGFEMSV